MSKNSLFLISLFTPILLTGQNLVVNSFLLFNTTSCTWTSSIGTLYLMSIDSCKQSTTFDPLAFGYYDVPKPKYGSGIVGIKPRHDGQAFVTDSRVFSCPQLSQSLDSGETYVVEFQFRPWHRNTYHPVHLGTVISDSLMPGMVGGSFQWTNSHTPDTELNQPLTDTANWTRYLQSFVADGDTSRRLVIGGFHSDTEPQIPNQVAQSSNAYHLGLSPIIWICAPQLYKASDTLFSVSLGRDTTLCFGESLNLSAVYDSGFKLLDTAQAWRWSTGSIQPSITVTSPGTYWVEYIVNGRFKARDQIEVSFIEPTPTDLGLGDTVTMCFDQALTLSPDAVTQGRYLWSTGDTSSALRVRDPGTYWVTASNSCYQVRDTVVVREVPCEQEFWIPNAFSPNQDGRNEVFRFENVPSPITLMVFDRWGQMVYFSDDYQHDWDGRDLSGTPLEAGVYTYKIQYRYFAIPNPPPGTPGALKEVTGVLRIYY
jgi:gliding motility-associated-like protein